MSRPPPAGSIHIQHYPILKYYVHLNMPSTTPQNPNPPSAQAPVPVPLRKPPPIQSEGNKSATRIKHEKISHGLSRQIFTPPCKNGANHQSMKAAEIKHEKNRRITNAAIQFSDDYVVGKQYTVVGGGKKGKREKVKK